MVVNKSSFCFAVCLFLLSLGFTNGTTCYHRNGQSLEDADSSAYNWQNYLPCNTSTSASMCCATGDINGTNSFTNWCRGDGLCQELKTGLIYRESCTDPTWKDPNCSQLCPDSPADERITICADKSICCGQSNTTCCDDGQGVFIDSVGAILSSTTSTSSLSTTTSSTSTSSQLSSTTSSDTTTSTPAASIAEVGDSTKSQGLSKGATIGIGVAVPLGLIAIAAICWVLFRRRQQSATFTSEEKLQDDAHFPTEQSYAYELTAQGSYELVGTKMVPEMEGSGLHGGYKDATPENVRYIPAHELEELR